METSNEGYLHDSALHQPVDQMLIDSLRLTYDNRRCNLAS